MERWSSHFFPLKGWRFAPLFLFFFFSFIHTLTSHNHSRSHFYLHITTNMSSVAANRVAVLVNHLSASATHPAGLLAGQVAIVTGAG
jgi:hypothetical protein